jgi:Outer membrane protein beta-barrel domain
MQCLRFIFIVIVTLVMTQTSVYAGNRAKTATVTVGGGGYFFANDRNLNDTGLAFLSLGYDLTDHWGVDALITGFSTQSKRPLDNNNGRQIRGSLFAFDGVYHLMLDSCVQPYALAGVGIIGLSPNGTNANNQGNINAGLGVQLFFHRDIAFRVEARDFYTMTSSFNDVFVSGGVSFLFDFC